jgi:hypothetical protein
MTVALFEIATTGVPFAAAFSGALIGLGASLGLTPAAPIESIAPLGQLSCPTGEHWAAQSY